MTLKDNAMQAMNALAFLNQSKASIASRLIKGHESYPYALRQMLAKFGDTQVTSIVICRTPLSKLMMKAIDVLSLGRLKERMQNQSFDKLFHLKLIINSRYSLEKHITSRLVLNSNVPKRSDTVVVSPVKQVTLNEMVANTHKLMGMHMFNYDAVTNNCQLFVTQVLKANGMWKEEYDNFINQNIATLVDDYFYTHGLVNAVTTTANRGQIVFEGEGLTKHKIPRTLTTTSESDLIEWSRRAGIPLVGVFMRDEMSVLKDGRYIMNLETMAEDGSHWTCFLKHRSNIYYFDSFGMVPPQNQVDIFKRNSYKVYYNTSILQDIDAKSCGWWCICFLKHMSSKSKQPMLSKMKLFNEMWSEKPKLNEQLLKKKIVTIYK